jgi:hypothetical protein
VSVTYECCSHPDPISEASIESTPGTITKGGPPALGFLWIRCDALIALSADEE